MLLASPVHCLPSEDVPQKTWLARLKVSCARMVTPLAVGVDGGVGFVVPTGPPGPILEEVEVGRLVPIFSGTVSAASSE